MWDLSGPGLEPVSPALAGGFLTTVPPGKPPESLKKKLPVVEGITKLVSFSGSTVERTEYLHLILNNGRNK